MRRLAFLFTALAACSPTSGTIEQKPVDAGADAPQIPLTATCTGDATKCLSGTVATKGMTAVPSASKVELYRVFPYGAAKPVKSQTVAKDGTFAFSDVDPWGHYFIQAVAKFGTGNDATSIAATRGPFVSPKTSDKIAITVVPVQIEVLQGKLSGAQATLQWASAHAFDPATGKEIVDATVSIGAGGKDVAMPYSTNIGGGKSYFVQFPSQVAVAATYTVTMSHAAFGGTPVTWQLAADPAAYDVAVTAPQDGASLTAGQPLDVTWPAQPLSDYGVVEIFVKSGASFVNKYTSQLAIAPDVTKETVPGTALADPGTYLLNLELSKASCPVTADGCVYAGSTATANLTVK